MSHLTKPQMLMNGNRSTKHVGKLKKEEGWEKQLVMRHVITHVTSESRKQMKDRIQSIQKVMKTHNLAEVEADLNKAN